MQTPGHAFRPVAPFCPAGRWGSDVRGSEGVSMQIRQLKLRTKLMLGFAALAAIVMLVSGLALRSLGRSNDRFTGYLEGVAERERMVEDIRVAANRRAISARNLVLVTDAADQQAELAAVNAAH